MERFNLEEYKKNPNRRVITRDGKSVRIVGTDMIGTSYPILVICRVDATHDCFYSYTINGKHSLNKDTHLDLFFAPEKRSGWVNIYRYTGNANTSRHVYDTAEEALKCASKERVDTIKIEWEE